MDSTEHTAIELLDHHHSEAVMHSMETGGTFKVSFTAAEIGQLLGEIHALQEKNTRLGKRAAAATDANTRVLQHAAMLRTQGMNALADTLTRLITTNPTS